MNATAATPTGTPPAYMFDNATDEAARQVELLADILDPHTTEVIDRIGVRPGWRALEIGPGRGTIAAQLARRVGPTGTVVTVDLDPRHVQPAPGVEIVTGDIRTVDLEPARFDLIHVRLVLMHLPDREEILARLVGLLKPGGVIVVSDWDCTWRDMLIDAPPSVRDAFAAFQTALTDIAQDHGVDPSWARTAPAAMRRAGLTDITATAYTPLCRGGEPGLLLHASNSRQREAALLAAGMTAADLETLRDGMTSPDTLGFAYLMFTTVGRRPGA
ncbi:methyltransferase domain-containing protein [Dactylosporangium sp. CA-139114]|uniref:methyltransferase domain-containing protein n=1 Tax=Dactylosporangium sp. CA-139114 TaxID=3239931 RepID=UPI003D97A26E